MIRNTILFVALVIVLCACQQQPPGLGMTAVTYDGQETHGGDISVAMLRASTLRLANNRRLFMSEEPSEDFRRHFSQFSKKVFVSFEGTPSDDLFFEGPEFVEVNRRRVMKMDLRNLGFQLVATYYQAPPFVSLSTEANWIGHQVTPAHVKERGERLMDQLQDCITRSKQSDEAGIMSKLAPHIARLDLEKRMVELRNIEVNYAATKLIDVKTKRRVDMGVTLHNPPQILLDKERVAEWRTDNFATDYLIFHEYSHVFKRKMNSEDSDYALSSELFYLCTIGGTWQYPELITDVQKY